MVIFMVCWVVDKLSMGHHVSGENLFFVVLGAAWFGRHAMSKFDQKKLKRRLFAAMRNLACLIAGVTSSVAVAAPYDATADTVFDIIQRGDASEFVCLADKGRGVRQMWDKRHNDEFDHNAYLFIAHFASGPGIEIVVNPEYADATDARTEAARYTRALGQLPALLRAGITLFGIHAGKASFHAGSGKIFVYAEQSTLRDSQNHLEESLFHEAVHASLDKSWRLAPEWQAAQRKDGAFLTDYGAEHPQREDLAETALFAYGLHFLPGRIPPVDEHDMRQTTPARIAFVADLFDRAPAATASPPRPEGCR